MQRKLTAAFVAKAEPPVSGDRVIYWDAAMPGFGFMVTANGKRSYVVQYRAHHRSRRLTIDGRLSLDRARREARKLQGEVAKGHDPLEQRRRLQRAEKNTLEAICREFLIRQAGKLRSIDQVRRVLEHRIFGKTLGRMQIEQIRRSDIVRLLDDIERDGGPVAADRCLAFVRRILNWHATRSDDFRSPIVRGMARTKPQERARDRILSDDELRAVWRATGGATGAFGPFVRFLLLTGARRQEGARMRWEEIDGEDWILPAARNKVKRELVRPLSEAARGVLAGLPRLGHFVFTLDGRGPLSGMDAPKRRLQEASGTTGWALHDLRRTARSLMSRAGVPDRHAEETLGHVAGGIRGTYDRHRYYEEKKRAYDALAAQIKLILDPRPNIVQLRAEPAT
jgi:integrase